MLRKLILGAVAVVAIGLSAGAVSAAPPIVVYPGTGGYLPAPGGYFPKPLPQPHRDHDYAVFVRHGNHWHRYGRYETRWQAERAERYLESRGHRAKIEVIHDHW